MEALALAFLLISALFAIERFYFNQKRGAFAIIFCVFLFQSFLLGICTFILSGNLGFTPSATLHSIFASLGGVALLTIGITPVFAAVCATFWLLVKLGQRLFSDRKQM